MIIEIVSPSYRNHETETKFENYTQLGVKEYWIVDPELKEVRDLEFKDLTLKSNTLFTEGLISARVNELQGLDIDVSELWKLTL